MEIMTYLFMMKIYYILGILGSGLLSALTDLMDPVCSIIYDKNDSLNNYLDQDRIIELNGTDKSKLRIRVLKKLWKNWYYCISSMPDAS